MEFTVFLFQLTIVLRFLPSTKAIRLSVREQGIDSITGAQDN
jgi:hypothetical protein